MQDETYFDYELQVWVKNNIVQRCSHPTTMRQYSACCNADNYHGFPIDEAKALHATPRADGSR